MTKGEMLSVFFAIKITESCVLETHPAQVKVLLCLDSRFWGPGLCWQGPGRPQHQQTHCTRCSPHSFTRVRVKPTVLRRNSPLTLFCPLSARVCLGPHLKCVAVISRQPWTSEFEAKTNNQINKCQNIKLEIKVKSLLGLNVNMF